MLLSSSCLLLSSFGNHPSAALAVAGPQQFQAVPTAEGQRIAQGQRVIINYPVIVPTPVPSYPRNRQVTVDFIAAGSDWGAVYINGQPLFRVYNTNRRQTFLLSPGAYYLEFTGVVQADCWARGYLDVGRNDSHVLVVTFSKQTGVWVNGDPTAWIPDLGSPPSQRGVCYPYLR